MQLGAASGGRRGCGWPAALAPCLLLAGSAPVEASRARRAAAPPARQGECDWTIHYSRWIPTFDHRVYAPKGAASGAACLEACCRDPACTGLAMESSMDSQCYRYAQVPPQLHGDRGLPLAQYVNTPREPAWSVFVKASALGADPRAAPPSLLLREEKASTPALRSVQEEAAVDAQLRRRLEPPHSCEWTVYYDKWIPSFQGGEYEHNNAYGGAHCLTACCEDPSCTGLALESSERYQCYKYGSVPAKLAGLHGEPLGDGAWLRQRKSKWSIMVKVEKPLQPAQLLATISRPPPTTEAASQAPAAAWHWASALAHVVALLAMVTLLVGSLCGALQRAELVSKKCFGGSCNPEASRLLEATRLPKARPS